MTNLDALKELATAAGATDVDDIDSNLDALNATAKALGGTGESDSNADAFHEIAENFSGGGGGGGIETAQVTIKLGAGISSASPAIPHIKENGAVAEKAFYGSTTISSTTVLTVPVPAIASASGVQAYTINSGNVEYLANNKQVHIKGDCELTITVSAN